MRDAASDAALPRAEHRGWNRVRVQRAERHAGSTTRPIRAAFAAKRGTLRAKFERLEHGLVSGRFFDGARFTWSTRRSRRVPLLACSTRSPRSAPSTAGQVQAVARGASRGAVGAAWPQSDYPRGARLPARRPYFSTTLVRHVVPGVAHALRDLEAEAVDHDAQSASIAGPRNHRARSSGFSGGMPMSPQSLPFSISVVSRPGCETPRA